MSTCGEVLVAIMNSRADMEIVRKQHWYRIPIEQVEKLKHRDRWHPKWLAFYQTKIFDHEAHAVNYYADVRAIHDVYRWELFPEQPSDAKSQQRYCKLELSSLKRLPNPIISKRLRRIAFIPTTWETLMQAKDMSDLWDESLLDKS
ncbi:MAG: hypothetical protein HC866_22880 [Leptolyngbyaceae cyanobacterium RU_5_1]|nr:hypothetical protein [Leptolyngbyaceae cyanobacterium RU_5_1]